MSEENFGAFGLTLETLEHILWMLSTILQEKNKKRVRIIILLVLRRELHCAFAGILKNLN